VYTRYGRYEKYIRVYTICTAKGVSPGNCNFCREFRADVQTADGAGKGGYCKRIRKEIERIVAAAEKIGISAGDIAAIVSEIRRAGGEQSRIEKPKTGMADGIA
jgi:hypothetical protein